MSVWGMRETTAFFSCWTEHSSFCIFPRATAAFAVGLRLCRLQGGDSGAEGTANPYREDRECFLNEYKSAANNTQSSIL